MQRISEVYFETYGCTANQNSTEIMQGLIKQAKLNITKNKDFADLIVINSCIVKEPTEQKIRQRVLEFLKQGKKVILAGCMPRFLDKEFKEKNNLYLLNTSHIKDIINLIRDIKTNNYEEEKYLKERNEVKLMLPKISKEKFIGITQISEGCLGECNYCIVKLAKGKLFSYPREKIIQSVTSDLENGCKEIWLTSQDNASYGTEQGKLLLPELLREILEIKHRFFLRLGMTNPDNILKILPELIEIYKNEKMFKFLHIPVQSGSNKILRLMNRKYTREDVLKIVGEFRKYFPDITISTDIIVGFPGETEEDFQETLDLIREMKPEILNRSNFYPRRNTEAAKLKQILAKITNDRATKLMKLHLEICNSIQEKFKNTQKRVLVDQKGFPGTYLARDENYKLFAVPSRENILGKIMNVKVKRIMPHYLIAEKI